MYIGLHVKYPLFLSDFNEIFNFVDKFSRNMQLSNFMKIRPVGAELFLADGRTGRGTRQIDRPNEANSRFPQFSERT
jgi:hypothetical protein